jgi:hypothetical protein
MGTQRMDGNVLCDHELVVSVEVVEGPGVDRALG